MQGFVKKLAAIAVVVTISTIAVRQVNASSLIGTSVTGSLVFGGFTPNYFDPANASIPATYLNSVGPTVVISPTETEFGYSDPVNTDTADFTSDQLFLQDVTSASATDASAVYSFTDTAFSGAHVTLASDSFDTPLSYKLIGDTLSISAAQFSSQGVQNATFNIAAAPESSSVVTFGVLLACGIGYAGYAARKKKASDSA